jgi:aminoglycoside N3'-acetyltransferase
MKLLKVAYFALHEKLPAPWQEGLRRLWMNSALRRRVRRRRADRARQERQEAITRHGRWGAPELLEMLRAHGLAEGDVVFVQCSYNDLHTFEGSPLLLLQVLQQVVGATGTLLMPAYTGCVTTAAQPFRPQTEPTYTGILCEIFRRSEGVVRSLHPRHSICGRGPQAAALLSGHEACVRADGPDSPFDRMRHLPRAKILTLGLPPGHVSFLHWVEDIEPQRLPFTVLRSEPVRGAVEMPDGSVREVLDWHVKSDVAARLSLGPVAGQLSKAACSFFQFRGIAVGIYAMPALAAELLHLRDQGIIHYS